MNRVADSFPTPKWTSPPPVPLQKPEDTLIDRLKTSLKVIIGNKLMSLVIVDFLSHCTDYWRVSQHPSSTEKEALLEKIKVTGVNILR